MPLPTGTTGGSGLSRSEAAILAWKKRPRAKPKNGALDPKIAARVKQILAGKQKGKGKAKAKPAGTKQEIANQNRAAVAKQGGMDKLEGVMVRLGAGMNSDLEKSGHDELIKKGLATRGADGKPKLTSAGKKWRSAADKGDVEAAGAAMADGRSGASESAAKETAKGAKQAERATAKAEREKAKAGKLTARAAKQKKQQQTQKQKAQARAKIASERAKAKAAKDAARAKPKPKAEAKPKATPKPLPAKPKAPVPPKATPKPKVTAKDVAAEVDTKVKAEVARIAAANARNRKALDMDEDTDTLAIKAGARHSRTDVQHLQSIHDSSVACGASCGAEDDEDADMPMDDEEEGVKAIKGIMDNPLYYAQHECSDIMQAANALSTMAMLIQSELVEEDEDTKHVDMLCDAAETLIEFIQSEIDELRGAAKDAANDASMGPMNKAVTDDSWLHIDGGAIKAIDDSDDIRGLAILYGTKATHDIERDYMDKDTDLWLDHWGWPKPITYHHGMDKDTRSDPVIGHWTKAIQTDEGVWLEGQLDRAHRYYKAIKELARRGYLKISSDSGPQWTIREPQSNGANYIKRWPLVAASVTVSPMEPRMLPVEVKAYLAEIGMDIDEDTEAINPPAIKADGREMADDERARAILLELELIELELETA